MHTLADDSLLRKKCSRHRRLSLAQQSVPDAMLIHQDMLQHSWRVHNPWRSNGFGCFKPLSVHNYIQTLSFTPGLTTLFSVKVAQTLRPNWEMLPARMQCEHRSPMHKRYSTLQQLAHIACSEG